jgi:hypothetical protein
MSFILVARTGTVGAPAEAYHADGVNSLGDRRAAYSDAMVAVDGEELSIPETVRERALLSLEHHVRNLEGEIIALQDALTLERSRAQILEASYEDLEGQFDDVTLSVRGLTEASAPRGVQDNQPIDATTVRVGAPEAADGSGLATRNDR